MTPWAWQASDKAGKRDPITVEASTYIEAKIRACHRFGFLEHTRHGIWPETWRVVVEVLRN